jgi:membrane protein DedA with SNARE-associated domain
VRTVIEWLISLPPGAVYLIAGGLVFAETGLIVGLVLPGEVTLLLVGFLAATGSVGLGPAIVVTALAAFAGDALAYAEGRYVGPRLEAGAVGRRIGARRWDHAAALVRRYGGRAVFVARFVAFARTLVPRLAAMSGLAYRRVVGWDALGVVAQVTGSVLVGYLAGQSYERVASLFGKASGALLGLVAVVVALVVFGRYLGRHPDPVAAAGVRMARWRPLRAVDRAHERIFRWLTTRFGVGGAVVGSVLLGTGLLLLVGVVLTLATNVLVSSSGVPLVDPAVRRWMAARRTPGASAVAEVIVAALRGTYLVIAAGVVGVLLPGWPAGSRAGRGRWGARSGPRWGAWWRADLVGIVGTVGAFLPLLILAVAVDWVGLSGADRGGLFANQVTLGTASLGMLAWLVSRGRVPWEVRVTAWTVACGLVIVLGGARLYLGASRLSEIVAATLLGGLWVVIFMVAWRTRDRVRAEEDESPADR